MRDDLIEADRAYSIIGAFLEVYNYFGYGLSETIYAGALEYELVDRGHKVACDVSVEASYKGRPIGWQRIDMIVDGRVIVEIKATEKLPPSTHSQIISYLRITPIQLGLILHFGPEAKSYREIHTDKREFAKRRVGSRHSSSSSVPGSQRGEPGTG